MLLGKTQVSDVTDFRIPELLGWIRAALWHHFIVLRTGRPRLTALHVGTRHTSDHAERASLTAMHVAGRDASL